MNWKINFLLLFLIWLCYIQESEGQAQGNRILLRDITSLTLYRGEYTTGRRSSPVPQIECTGGTANGRFSPKAVQCYNRGWDGRDVQWECKAELPEEYQFGKIEVSCEGYDYPNDPYILAGSCGLRYELDYSSSGAKKYTYTTPSMLSKPSWLNFEKIVTICVVLFIVYLIYLMLSGGSTGQRTGGGGGGGWGPGHPPDGGRRPPPPGWNPPPPSYDDATGGYSSKPTNASGSGSGPGFFSGMGLGAMGGYLFGRNWGGGYGGYGYGGDGYGSSEYRYRGRPSSSYGGSSYNDGAGPSTSSGTSSGSTHTSSGYGGTSRR